MINSIDTMGYGQHTENVLVAFQMIKKFYYDCYFLYTLYMHIPKYNYYRYVYTFKMAINEPNMLFKRQNHMVVTIVKY